jgi:signal peptidase I
MIGMAAVVGLSALVRQIAHPVVVQGESMEPTFTHGQRLWVTEAYWLFGGLKANDVVLVRSPEDGDVLIKRVYRLPGQELDWDAPTLQQVGNRRFVPANAIIIVGDNPEVSVDSRDFGPVPLNHVIGKVLQ